MEKIRNGTLALACAALSLGTGWAADGPPARANAEAQSLEIAQLKAQLEQQQKQIEALRTAVETQQKLLERVVAALPPTAEAERTVAAEQRVHRAPSLGEVVSTSPIIPAVSSERTAVASLALPSPLPSAQASAPAQKDQATGFAEVSKKLDSLTRSLGGFRLSGDLRFRYDLQSRSSSPVAGPLQNSRERYRFRLNVDKDLFFNEKSNAPLFKVHAQLATAPFNNPITMDTDFAGVDTRAPISVSEAWLDFTPAKGVTLRAGRTTELFADNRQFVWDDDIRFNGFHETYLYTAKNSAFIEIKAAQYILTNPNAPIVGDGSPFLNAGYSLGQKVRSSALFDQGVTVGSNIGKKWSHNWSFNYNTVREPNQIQLASTAAGFPLLTNPAVGATLTGALPQTGNATTSSGGAIYFANGFDVLRGAFNLNYSGSQFHGRNFPFQLFLQATHNTSASVDENGYALGASVGQTAQLGDVQFSYQYLFKPANAFISQFTDDDVGTGTGVNVKVHAIRLNFGLARFLVWENRLFLQKGISRSNPAINFFVPLQQGYDTSVRLQSQFVFTF